MADDDEHYDEALANDGDRQTKKNKAEKDDPFDDDDFVFDLQRIQDED